MSDVTILELWMLMKVCNFYRKIWMVNLVHFGQFQLLVHQQLPIPNPRPVVSNCAPVSRAACTQLAGAGMGQLPDMAIRAISSKYWGSEL